MEKFSDPSTIGTVATLEELIVRLKEVFSGDRVNIDYVKVLLESYKLNPKEWKKFAKFDPHRYTRNLVDDGDGKFTMMILCWGEGQGSSIHSHANSHCFLKILDGKMVETLYEWPEDGQLDDGSQPMKKRDTLTFKKDEVTYIDDTICLHRMENPSNSDGAVTLHVYSPPFQECMCFDDRTTRRTTAKMTFWSKYGERDAA